VVIEPKGPLGTSATSRSPPNAQPSKPTRKRRKAAENSVKTIAFLWGNVEAAIAGRIDPSWQQGMWSSNLPGVGTSATSRSPPNAQPSKPTRKRRKAAENSVLNQYYEKPSTELSSTEVVNTWVSIVLQQKHPPNHCEETVARRVISSGVSREFLIVSSGYSMCGPQLLTKMLS
jgi:hypothetical protein